MSDEEASDSTEAFVDAIPLAKVFGLHPKTQILAAMLSESDDELAAFTESEVTQITGIDEAEFSENLDDLLEYDLVIETDDVPGTATYRLNHDNRAVDALLELNEELAEQFRS